MLFFAKTTLVVPPKTLWALAAVSPSLREPVLKVTTHFFGSAHDTLIVDQSPFNRGSTDSSPAQGKYALLCEMITLRLICRVSKNSLTFASISAPYITLLSAASGCTQSIKRGANNDLRVIFIRNAPIFLYPY